MVRQITINCPFEKLYNYNCLVTKPPHIKKITETAYTDDDKINMEFINEYNTSLKFVSFETSINNVIKYKYSSHPEINDSFFTKLFQTVCGKKTEYSAVFDKFIKQYKLPYYLPHMSNISQILSAVKNEMTVVTNNNIKLNFKNRTVQTIKWRLLDFLVKQDNFKENKKWNIYLQKITQLIYGYLSGCKDTIFTDISTANKMYGIHIHPKSITDIFDEDVAIFSWIWKEDQNTRKYKKKKNEEAPSKDNKKDTNFYSVIKDNPHKLVKYMYFSQRKIKKLKLTKEYDTIIEGINNSEGNKSKMFTDKWKWGKIRKPGFKLMPLNDIKNHFIRIDKRVFKEIGLCNLFSSPTEKKKYDISVTETITSDKIIWSKITNATNNVFINSEKTRLIELKEYSESSDTWWIENIFNIYSKKANIRQLQKERYIRSPSMFDSFMSVKDKNDYSPWIPGASFMTDGLQVKLILNTF